MHTQFLQRVAERLPAGVAPIIIAEAWFQVPFFRLVEKHDWHWVGRFRGRDFVHLESSWIICAPPSAPAVPRSHPAHPGVLLFQLVTLFLVIGDRPRFLIVDGKMQDNATWKQANVILALARAYGF